MGPLNLNPEQELQLRQLHSEYTHALAHWQFNDPANDQLLMRQHAAMSGKLELVEQLLDFFGESTKQQQQKLEQKLENSSAVPEDDQLGFQF